MSLITPTIAAFKCGSNEVHTNSEKRNVMMDQLIPVNYFLGNRKNHTLSTDDSTPTNQTFICMGLTANDVL